MSKLYDLFEAYNTVSSMCELINICKTTEKDAIKALETDPYSEELLSIYCRAKGDRDFLEGFYAELKDEYESLYAEMKNDKEFISEVENTTDVPEEYELILVALKSELGLKSDEKRMEK